MHNDKCKDVPGRTPRKTMTNFTAIATHLQASKIIEVREWVKVLWVKAIVAGRVVCRFVSKKIGATEMNPREKFDAMSSQLNFKLIATYGKENIKSDALSRMWGLLDRIGTGGTYENPYMNASFILAKMPECIREELVELAHAIEAEKQSADNRSKTEKALDNIYGAGNWTQRDREDYEG